MFAAIKQFFSMITVLFSAGERTAKALDNMAAWAEESSGQFNDMARNERALKLEIHKAKFKVLKENVDEVAKLELENDRKHQEALRQKELGNSTQAD